MDLGGSVTLSGQNAVVNGEVISGQNITFNNGSEVEAVQTVPEASTTAYFTLGPLSLVAVSCCTDAFRAGDGRLFAVVTTRQKASSAPCDMVLIQKTEAGRTHSEPRTRNLKSIS